MSCGQLALDRAGIPYDLYFASEVDKYAMSVTRQRYPQTIHLGDVTAVTGGILSPIHLLLGGSPCQGLSFAGKGLLFEDPLSRLFFEYARILKECREVNSEIKFLFENVRMKQEWRDVITDLLGVEPVRINSALVSAHNRVRDYWTNIPVDGQPEDAGIMLADIIESGCTDRMKSYAIDASYYKGGSKGVDLYFRKARRQLIFFKGRGNNPPGFRAFDGKVPTLTGSRWEMNNFLADVTGYRKLTPVECERLQTVPDNYTALVSNTQRYKMLGNGWTIDVIAHILKGLL